MKLLKPNEIGLITQNPILTICPATILVPKLQDLAHRKKTQNEQKMRNNHDSKAASRKMILLYAKTNDHDSGYKSSNILPPNEHGSIRYGWVDMNIQGI